MSPGFRRIMLQRAARLFDLAAVTLTFIAALAITSGSFSWPSLAQVLLVRIKVVNILVFGAYLGVCSAIFSICGIYLSHRLSHWTRQAREAFAATTFITGVLLVVPFQMVFVTKEFLFVFWLLTFSLVALARVLGLQLLYYARSRGRNLRNLVIVGEGVEAIALADRIEKETTLGYRVLRIINAKEICDNEQVASSRPT